MSMMQDAIGLFMHCRKCYSERIYPDISAGMSHGEDPKLIIWCNYHDEIVATFELKNPPKDATCECCRTEKMQ